MSKKQPEAPPDEPTTEHVVHVGGYVLAIDDDHDVWIDTDQAGKVGEGHHDGICIGQGKTLAAALADAAGMLATLQEAITAAGGVDPTDGKVPDAFGRSYFAPTPPAPKEA